MRYSGFIILMFVGNIHNCIAQLLPDYRIIIGADIGYRKMDMSEANERYSYWGYGPVKTDKPGEKYEFKGAPVKPFNNSIVYTGYIKVRPFKNYGFFLACKYDYMPPARRVETLTHTYTVPVMKGNTNQQIGTDTVTDISSRDTKMTVSSTYVALGYSFAWRKINLEAEMDFSYNTFVIDGNISGIIYQTGPFYDMPLIYPKEYLLAGKAYDYGVSFHVSCSYKIWRRFYVNGKIGYNFADLPIDDFYYHKDYWYTYHTIPTPFGNIYLTNYLSAQLSGFQAEAGISYRIF
jgi:hypothetical protein